MAKKENNELEKRNQAFLIYQDENGIARVNVRFEGEDVWLNVEQMMELLMLRNRMLAITSIKYMPRMSKTQNELTKNFC